MTQDVLGFHAYLMSRCSLDPSRIMGLYVSVVLVIGKFVRGFFSEISHSIMFEELPCVDRILKLCTDIFLVSSLRGPHVHVPPIRDCNM